MNSWKADNTFNVLALKTIHISSVRKVLQSSVQFLTVRDIAKIQFLPNNYIVIENLKCIEVLANLFNNVAKNLHYYQFLMVYIIFCIH